MSADTAQQTPGQAVERDVCAFSSVALTLLTPDQVSRAALALMVAHIHNWYQAWSSALQHHVQAPHTHTHTQMQDHTLLKGEGIDKMCQWPGGMQLVV